MARTGREITQIAKWTTDQAVPGERVVASLLGEEAREPVKNVVL